MQTPHRIFLFNESSLKKKKKFFCKKRPYYEVGSEEKTVPFHLVAKGSVVARTYLVITLLSHAVSLLSAMNGDHF